MIVVRKFQSLVVGVVGTLLTVITLHFLASHTSVRLVIKPLNSAPVVENTPATNSTQSAHYNTTFPWKSAGKYVPDHIWWTSEKHHDPKFAYAQYATNAQYFCNALINTDLLIKFKTKADLVIMYPEPWNRLSPDSIEGKILANAATNYPELHLVPVPIISTPRTGSDPTWRESLTKFNAFRLTEYSRVMYFDSDSLVLNSMDHYFLAPLARLAVPRAYWLGDSSTSLATQTISSHVMLLQPDSYTYNTIMKTAEDSGDLDMEVINHMFNNSAMILPHRRLALLTGEFRSDNHQKYLSDEPDSEWDPLAELSRSVLVHFSDYPLPKPWLPHTQKQWEAALPACDEDEEVSDDRPVCANRAMWTGLYEDYNYYMSQVCGDFAS